MHNAFLMRGFQPCARLDGDVESLLERQRAGLDLLLDTLTFDELHGDEAMFFIDFVDGANIGMIQRCRGLCFSEKALAVFCGMRRKELQRNRATEFQIFGFIDDTHPALAQLFEDSVVGYG
jgi:hypothetical protein